MELTPQTRLAELLEAHPFLTDWLVDYAPAFDKLKSPVLRQTLGRVATLEMAAEMAAIPLDTLLADLSEVIAVQSGEPGDRSAGPAPVDSAAGGGDEPEQEPDEIDPARLETLKGIIRDLHAGTAVEELKSRFADLLADVSPTEISRMEQQLISEGLPTEQVQGLCDVHVRVFRDSLDAQEKVETPPGHPVHTFQAENAALRQVVEDLNRILSGLGEEPSADAFGAVRDELGARLEALGQIDRHYLRKENQLFPVLESKGVSGPPQVMWAIHDQIRRDLKELRSAFEAGDAATLAGRGPAVTEQIIEMIYKEENILHPMAMEILNVADWARIYDGEEEVGFALVDRGSEWTPPESVLRQAAEGSEAEPTAALPLDTGLLSLEQINLLLTHLPVDVSFVDENDEVRYYSDSPDRLFTRTPAVIGRTVQNCHPPDSVHMVNAILDAFRSGEQDTAEFWIQMKGRFVHIRYFAMRDAEGEYRGCLEVSQDVTGIRALEGERRLLEWESDS